jgi:hypothetical protein
VLTREHRFRERNRSLVNKKVTGRLECEVCAFDFFAVNGEIGWNFAEVITRYQSLTWPRLAKPALRPRNRLRELPPDAAPRQALENGSRTEEAGAEG